MIPQERLAAGIALDRETRAKWRCPKVKIEQFQVKPFVVYAVEITEDNAQEVAAWCKGHVGQNPIPGMEDLAPTTVTMRHEVVGNGIAHYEHQVGYVGDRVIMNPDKSYTIMHKAEFEERFAPMNGSNRWTFDDDV